MEPLIGLVVAAMAGSFAYLVTSERRRAHLRVWRTAAQSAGLVEIEEADGFFEGQHLAGRSGDLQVRLEPYRGGKHPRQATRIVVTGFGFGVGCLSLRREGLAAAFEKNVVGEREIQVGDPSFDDECYVQGQPPLALAILDPETRRRVGDLLRGRVAVPGREPIEVGASLHGGVLEVRVEERGFSSNRERVQEVLAGVLEVARLLVAPRDVAARIASNLRVEPEEGARLRGVLMLAREFPSHPATREALLAAREDASEEVRLRAAMALGEEGRETLLDLVQRTGTDDSCAARAIAALGDRLPAARAEAALRRALGGAGRPQTAQSCLAALALLGRTEAEGLILDALRSEDGQVAVAAAKALGRVGTVAAVAALREAGEAGGEMRRAARQSIAEIQARLTGAEPGQLSLAGGEAGALSLADETAEPGRLSLAGEEPEEARHPEEHRSSRDGGEAQSVVSGSPREGDPQVS